MNRGNPGVILLILFLMLGGLYSMASVLLTSGNTIGELCRFLLVGGFVFCLISPRVGFFIWLTFCGYNDLVKRLLVIGGRVTQDDLTFVLGITPAMFGGVITSLIVGGLMHSRPVTMRDWRSLGIGILLMLLAGAAAARHPGAGVNGVLQAMANDGLYSLLLFVLPVLFHTSVEIQAIWRYLVFAFAPVAIYGVVQQVFGWADFEIEYLMSGLSVEMKQLYSGQVRAFSTLNSPTALSVVCACLAVLSLYLGFSTPKRGQKPALSRPVALLFFFIHSAGLVASASRTPMMIPMLALIGGWCFAKPGRTRVFYVMSVGSFVALVLISPWLAPRLDDISVAVASAGPSGGFLSHMIVIGTYWDRVQGFASVLMNPAAWSLFGHGVREDGTGVYFYHDPVSEILVKYGALALVATLVLLFLVLRSFHRTAWSMKDEPSRKFAARMIALTFSMVMISAIGGSVLSTFPNNILFWMSLSTVVVVSRDSLRAARQNSQPAMGRVRRPLVDPQPQPRLV
ncbi:hypothetical protein [Prosthecobacter sp.]|uniref:hypothetical protein n=1 Tax=Prosthecobacter sp. TaxID=1965333 RepID=UPI003783C068